MHVAILLKPYLDMLLAGRKTIECRLTRTAVPPFGVVEPGERIWFKQSAGRFRATAVAERVEFADKLSAARIERIRRQHNRLIAGDDAFWSSRRDCRYLTLIWLAEIEAVSRGPQVPPQRGRAWLVLGDGVARA